MLTLLLASSGCAITPPDLMDDGAFCERATSGRPWDLRVRSWSDLDLASVWLDSPEKEQELLTWGMGGGKGWDILAGEGTENVFSPYGRTLNVYALLDQGSEGVDLNEPLDDYEHYATPLQWFAAYVWQKSPEVHGSCVKTGPAARYKTYRGDAWVTVYGKSYGMDIVARAATLVHEVRHDFHLSHSPDEEWADGGAYTFEALYFAALYHSPDSNDEIRTLAKKHFNERAGKIQGHSWTLADFDGKSTEYYVAVAPFQGSP